MTDKKVVLVAGGAGYIGSHACKALFENGYTPVTYDNLEFGHEWAVRWGPFEYGDIHDKDRLSKVLDQYRPIAVLHFAAYAYVGESVENPLKYYRNNVSGTLTLLEIMREKNIEKLVFSSTCATYGDPVQDYISESHPQDPINPYGSTKLMVEKILQNMERAHGLKSISLRYFNAAGADADSEIGEAHDPETHLIPLALEAAIGMREPLTIFGDDYDTPDGTCIRDYIHVTDLANAHVSALKQLERGGSTACYNLGIGQGYSVFEVVDAIKRVTGREVPHHIGSRRVGDPPSLVADSSNFCSEMDWTPEFSDLDTIVDTAWRWLQVNPERKRT